MLGLCLVFLLSSSSFFFFSHWVFFFSRGSVGLGIGVKEKKEIKKEIKAAPSQFVSPTKSKFF